MVIVKPRGGEIACVRCGEIVNVPAGASHHTNECVYRGDIIGTAKCGCTGKPKVYQCDIHGFAMDRKLKPGKVPVTISDGTKHCIDMQYCNACDDHTPDNGRTYRKSIRIVTSFSPHRTDRQLSCLASWRSFGMPIVAVQPASEIDAMAATYEGVDWIACEGQRPTIAELASVANGGPILLINSDIAIESTMPEFRRDWLAIEEQTLRVGCRWEILDDGTSYLQRWGIDAFLITPEMLADFRDLGFYIGQPAWDYWFVIHYSAAGYKIAAKVDAGLSHQFHPAVWTQAECTNRINLIAREYGIESDEQNKLISELTSRS